MSGLQVWWKRPRLWFIVLLAVAVPGTAALTVFLRGEGRTHAGEWLTILGGYLAIVVAVVPALVWLWRHSGTAAGASSAARVAAAVAVEIDDETDPRRPVRRKARLLFVNGDGNPIRRTSWSPVWTPAAATAGLPDGFGYHGLRHYFATLLIHAGASVKTVQLALGHSSPTVTLNTYTHEWPEAIDRTRTLVDNALGRSSTAATGTVARRSVWRELYPTCTR